MKNVEDQTIDSLLIQIDAIAGRYSDDNGIPFTDDERMIELRAAVREWLKNNA